MHKADEPEKPKVLVPFSGTEGADGFQDVFVYLRPETNGMLTESSMFRVLRNNPVYAEHTKVVYLANIPGGFLIRNRIIEDHYHIKVDFAKKGKMMFTQAMKHRFEEYFKEDFQNADILGAYAFLEKTGMEEEEVFNLWVDEGDYLIINGQSVKRWKGMYIINYDIPALLHKNNSDTNIAVFLLRTSLDSTAFRDMIRDMETALLAAGILKKGMPPSRIFHYSKSPFEQILDGKGFLYKPDGSHEPIEALCFFQYLRSQGITSSEIIDLIEHPIQTVLSSDGEETECNLFTCTAGFDYPRACSFIEQRVSYHH